MSVEKLSDISKVLIEQFPFTQIPNNVIQHIKDNDAFRLYCYLFSKSRDWTVVKEYAAKECGIGERKSRACWSYLARCKLIEYRVEKDEKGKIIKHDMVVLVGLKFDKNVSFKPVDKSIGAKTASVEKTHRGKNPPSGQSTRVDFAPLLNKDITNKEKETKERESTARKKRSPLPQDFVFDEANQLRCKDKGLDIEKVLDKFRAWARAGGIKRVDWQSEAEIWIIRERPCKPEPTNKNSTGEIKCTIKEFTKEPDTNRSKPEIARKNIEEMRKVLSGRRKEEVIIVSAQTCST